MDCRQGVDKDRRLVDRVRGQLSEPHEQLIVLGHRARPRRQLPVHGLLKLNIVVTTTTTTVTTTTTTITATTTIATTTTYHSYDYYYYDYYYDWSSLLCGNHYNAQYFET